MLRNIRDYLSMQTVQSIVQNLMTFFSVRITSMIVVFHKNRGYSFTLLTRLSNSWTLGAYNLMNNNVILFERISLELK